MTPRHNRLGGNPGPVFIPLFGGVRIRIHGDIAPAAFVQFGLQFGGGEVHFHAVADIAQQNLGFVRVGINRSKVHVDQRESRVEHHAYRGAACHADRTGEHQVAGGKTLGIGLFRLDVEGDIERICTTLVVGIVCIEIQVLVGRPLCRGVSLQRPGRSVVDQLGIVEHVPFALEFASERRCKHTDGVPPIPGKLELLIQVGAGKRIELCIELDGNRGEGGLF